MAKQVALRFNKMNETYYELKIITIQQRHSLIFATVASRQQKKDCHAGKEISCFSRVIALFF